MKYAGGDSDGYKMIHKKCLFKLRRQREDFIMFKKILSSFLVVWLLCSISITVFASSSSLSDKHTFDQMIPLEIQEAMENQAAALGEYFELIKYFNKDKYGSPIYPQHYAGEYIDKNNKLVVQLTYEFADKEILSYLKSSPNIQIVYVEHSYNELISQKKIADELYASGVRVVSDGVDIIDNRYEIAVLKEDLNKMSTTYTKDSIVVFEEGTYAQASAQLFGGDRIYNEDSGGYMSIGICGTYNGNDAILTCGHGNEKVGIWSPRYPYIENKTQSHRIGQVVFQQADTDSSNYGGPVWRSDTGENLIHGIVTAGNVNTNLMYTTPIYYAQNQGFQPKVD